MLFFNCIQATLVTAFAVTAPNVEAPEPEDVEIAEPADEADEEVMERRYVLCSASFGAGRQWARLEEVKPGQCTRFKLGPTLPGIGAVDASQETCYSVAKEWNCSVVDI